MAQTAANSCLVCNSLIRSNRHRRDLTEATVSDSGDEITICARIEAVLNVLVSDSAATAICESCYFDLEQIENLVRQFRGRYNGTLQTRNKWPENAKKLKYDLTLSQDAFSIDVLVNLKKTDSSKKSATIEIKEEVQWGSYGFQQGEDALGSVEVNGEAKTSRVDASEKEYGAQVKEVEVDDGDGASYNDGSTYEEFAEENSEELYTSETDQSEEEWVAYKTKSRPKRKAKIRTSKPAKITRHAKLTKSTKLTKTVKLTKQVNPKNRATCPHCNISDTKYKISKHIKNMHADIEPITTKDPQENLHLNFQCMLCSKRFRTQQKLRRHKAYHRGRKPYICVVCDKRFLWSWHLKKHVVTHSGALPYTCCDTTYTVGTKLALHMVSHKEATTIMCPVCGEKFANYLKRRDHRNEIHGGIVNKCPICNQVFKRANKLKLHMEYHQVGGFKCDVCLKVFKTKASLEIHRRLHTGDVCTCGECGKSYATQAYLNIHMRTHTGERDYLCSFCGKGFADSNALNRHTNTHREDRKQYECHQCGKAFMRSDHLTKHIATHTGVKPFLCSICGKGFSRLDKMKNHMRIHTKPPREKVVIVKEKKPKKVKPPPDPNAPKRKHKKKVKPLVKFDAQPVTVEDKKHSISPPGKTDNYGTASHLLITNLPGDIRSSHDGPIGDGLAMAAAYQSGHVGIGTHVRTESALTLYQSIYMNERNPELKYEYDLKPQVSALNQLTPNPPERPPMHSVD